MSLPVLFVPGAPVMGSPDDAVARTKDSPMGLRPEKFAKVASSIVPTFSGFVAPGTVTLTIPSLEIDTDVADIDKLFTAERAAVKTEDATLIAESAIVELPEHAMTGARGV